MTREQFLWVEKYRPRTVEDCILPDELKDTFSGFVEQGAIPNLLLSGGPGSGKTTVARALCEQVGCDYLMVNGSEEGRSIDILRTDIKAFAASVSLMGTGRKMVIMDEADYCNPTSTQPALRGFIEEFSNNCGFIFTCNYRNRIIEPIHSRCSVIEFKIVNGQKVNIANEFLERTKEILDTEKIKYEEKVVAALITKHFPDFRRVLNELQRYSVSGTIDTGILVNLSEDNLNELMRGLKEKKFSEVRKWVVNNLDNDPQKIFRRIYDSLYSVLAPASIPQAVVTLAEYQYKAAFAADQEINLVACLTELMVEAKFK
jgi:DNA polymerase III delta prime subunit